MMTEWDWYETTEELVREHSVGDWNRLVSLATEVHRRDNLNEDRTDEQVKEVLHGLLRKLQGFPPTWLAIVGPDGDVETPDDIWIEPAWNRVEVQRLWDNHDGRNYGTAIVGVYIWSYESNKWTRDENWGILGQEGKTGPADRDDEHDRIC
jgi:hypothetical protein